MIFAVDPGSEKSAIVAFNGERVLWARIMPNPALLEMIRKSGEALRGKRLWIELIGHYGKGMPAGRDVFDTCIYIGELKEAAHTQGASTRLVLRATVKTHVCGTPKAKDSNIRQSLIDKYGKPGTKSAPGFFYGFSADMWQAMALADYAYASL